MSRLIYAEYNLYMFLHGSGHIQHVVISTIAQQLLVKRCYPDRLSRLNRRFVSAAAMVVVSF